MIIHQHAFLFPPPLRSVLFDNKWSWVKKKTETKKRLMVNQESAPTHMTFFKTVD